MYRGDIQNKYRGRVSKTHGLLEGSNMDYTISNAKSDPKAGEGVGNSLTQVDTFLGDRVDLNYSVIPAEKDAIAANLKAAGDAVKAKFGLDERGLPELK